MVAQVVAYRHPTRTLSLTSIMSNTGNPRLAQGNPDAIQAVIAPPPTERAAYIEHNMMVWKKIWSAGFPFEEKRARAFLENSYDRSYYPDGAVRQNLALLARGNRTLALSGIRAPTLVIHGSADPLIPVEAGEETAQVIPGATLVVIDGMGHDLPAGAWPQIISAFLSHIEQA
jgi:pimeloyl-ACP methyl ester carboxylesterase